MASENNEKFSLLERLRHTYYRLVILNHDTFEEVGSYKLSLLSFYILLSSIFMAVALLVLALIVYTPLKRYLPGFEPGANDGLVLELTDKVDDMAATIRDQQTYIDNFRNLIENKVETKEKVPVSVVKVNDSLTNVQRNDAENQIRKQVESGAAIVNIPNKDAADGKIKTVNFSPKDSRLDKMYFVAPVNGEVSAPFMPDKRHLGVDVIAPKNTAIKAAMDGFIISSDWTLETGNTIGIQHANNIVTFYKHNSVLLKKTGDHVKAGEAIAIIGNTGELTTGPHLHFELWQKGHAVNPADYIQF